MGPDEKAAQSAAAGKGCAYGCMGLMVIAMVFWLAGVFSGGGAKSPAPDPAANLSPQAREFILGIPKRFTDAMVLEKWREDVGVAYVNPLQWYNLDVDQKKFFVRQLAQYQVLKGHTDFITVRDNRTDKELASGSTGLVSLK